MRPKTRHNCKKWLQNICAQNVKGALNRHSVAFSRANFWSFLWTESRALKRGLECWGGLVIWADHIGKYHHFAVGTCPVWAPTLTVKETIDCTANVFTSGSSIRGNLGQPTLGSGAPRNRFEASLCPEPSLATISLDPVASEPPSGVTLDAGIQGKHAGSAAYCSLCNSTTETTVLWTLPFPDLLWCHNIKDMLKHLNTLAAKEFMEKIWYLGPKTNILGNEFMSTTSFTLFTVFTVLNQGCQAKFLLDRWKRVPWSSLISNEPNFLPNLHQAIAMILEMGLQRFMKYTKSPVTWSVYGTEWPNQSFTLLFSKHSFEFTKYTVSWCKVTPFITQHWENLTSSRLQP